MYSFKSRVRYSEVNSEKELAIPSLLNYLQDCCSFQSEDYGVGNSYLEQGHGAWVISSWQIEILRYPKLGEEISICTWPYEFTGCYGYRNFTVEDGAGQIIVKVNSLWVYMDTNTMRPARVPPHILDVYRDAMQEALSGAWEGRKIELPAQGEEKAPVPVPQFFIDSNHHMNNGKYVLVAQEYLPAAFRASRLRVEYKKAALQGDMLYPSVSRDGQQVTVVLSDESQNVYAAVQFR